MVAGLGETGVEDGAIGILLRQMPVVSGSSRVVGRLETQLSQVAAGARVVGILLKQALPSGDRPSGLTPPRVQRAQVLQRDLVGWLHLQGKPILSERVGEHALADVGLAQVDVLLGVTLAGGGWSSGVESQRQQSEWNQPAD